MEKHTHDGKTYFVNPINKQPYDANFFISKRGQIKFRKGMKVLSRINNLSRSVSWTGRENIPLPIPLTLEEVNHLEDMFWVLFHMLEE